MVLETPVRPVAIDPASVALSLCTYCGVGDPVVADPRPDAPHRAVASGPLGCCSKGAFALATNDRIDGDRGPRATAYPRLLAPEIKVHGRWRVVSWDEALEYAARELLKRRAKFGRRAVAFYGVGQAPIESYWITKKLFQGYLGTNHVGTNAELCLAASAGGHELVFGNEGSFTSYEDYKLADAIVLYGSNQAINHPTIFRRYFLSNRTAVRFVVDPRVTETVRAALKGPGEAHHVRIKSGGDVILNASIAHRLFQRGWVDAAYLGRHVDPASLADYRALVGEPRFEPTAAARLLSNDEDSAAVLAAQIERMAEVWGRRPEGALSVVTTSSVGINQSTGSQGVASILNLHLLTGTIGTPGNGHVRVAGQSNAPSELAMGFSSLLLPFRLSVKERRNRVRIGHHWGVPPWMISELPGSPVTKYAHSDEIKFLVTMGCDFLRNLTDTDRLERWLEDVFVVTCDPYPNPACREHCDVLLPARTHREVTGVYMTGERRVQLMHAQADPPCDAWDDVTILVELANKVAGGLLGWESGSTVFRKAREQLLQWSWIYSDTRRWPPANPTEADVEERAKMGNLDLDPHPIRGAFDYPRDARRQVITERVWNELREASVGLYNELADEAGPITYARMRAEGGVRWGGARRYTPDVVGDARDPGAIFPGRYQHTKSRARLHSPDADLLADPRPPGVTILNTGRGVIGPGQEARNVAMFNSCVKSGHDVLPDQHTLALHPDDAARLGVRDGALVIVESDAGRLALPALITTDVSAGEPYVPFQPDRARTPINRICLPNKLDPVVNQPRLKRLIVRLARWVVPSDADPAEPAEATLAALNAPTARPSRATWRARVRAWVGR